MDLKERQKGIGGSDVAPILGFSRFSTAVDIWNKKISDTKELELKPDDNATSLMYWGHAMEKPIINAYSETTNNKVIPGDEIGQLSHPEYPWLIANVDGFAFCGDEKIIFEAKYTQYISKDWGEQWSDKIPIEYFCQVQHYMHVCDLQEAHLAAWISGNLKIFKIKRSDEIIDKMLPILDKFWHENVLKLIPPEPQNLGDVKFIYPSDNGSEKVATDELVKTVDETKSIDEEIKRLKKISESNKGNIGKFLEANSKLVSNDGRVLARFSTRKDGKRVMRIA